MQGFMLDSARCLERRDYYPRLLRFAAERGVDTILWHFTDDQGCTLRFDSVPEAASPHAYTKAELADLLRCARDHGITVIPELETLGHTRYLTRAAERYHHLAENNEEFTSICPVSPDSRKVIGKLLDETVELFDAPYVHVGLDEVNFGDHPLTREALKRQSPGDLYADYVRFLHDHLARRGRGMMMWGDHLLKDETIAPQVPRDIVVCNWQYTPEVPRATTQRLLDWGFEVVLCPALISHDQPLYPGQAFAVPNLRSIAGHAGMSGKGRVHGSITTVWTPMRFMHDALWMALDLAAAVMREGGDVDLRETLATFAERFHGFTPPAEWVDACEQVFEMMPMRKEWLAVVKLDDKSATFPGDVAARAVRWGQVAEALRGSRERVTREAQSYETLVLMAELLAHACDRAAAVVSGAVTGRHLDEAEAMLRRLSDVWDRERYADDPRKWRPVFPFDADNHLLVVVREGNERLRRRCHAPAV